MTRAPATIAVVALAFAARTTAAEPCAPRAELTGDAAAVAKVRVELSRIGVVTGVVTGGGAGGACRAVHARVQPADHGGLAVAVVDRSGRSEGREVSDAALAAAWIDSWLRDDLDAVAGGEALALPAAAPVLVPADGAAGGAALGATPVLTARAERPDPGPAPRRSVLDRGALTVGYEQAFTGTAAGESWDGGSVAACVMIGPLCVGASAHYAHQPTTSASTGELTRSETVVLATASAALKLGPVAIEPELGLGGGRFWEQGTQMCATPASGMECAPTDPTCGVCPAGQPSVSRAVTSYAPRGSAALRLSVAMFAHVWLDASASVIFTPAAHGTFAPDQTPVSAGPVETSTISLPGEPQTSLALGVGLRVGMP